MTVSIGNTELPADAFVVSGFDVSGLIPNEGLRSAEFVLFSRKNVSWTELFIVIRSSSQSKR